MPYEHGNIEGSDFAIQWLCEILNLNIYLWIIEAKSIDMKFHAKNPLSKLLYLMHCLFGPSHGHFQLLT